MTLRSAYGKLRTELSQSVRIQYRAAFTARPPGASEYMDAVNGRSISESPGSLLPTGHELRGAWRV